MTKKEKKKDKTKNTVLRPGKFSNATLVFRQKQIWYICERRLMIMAKKQPGLEHMWPYAIMGRFIFFFLLGMGSI